MRVLAVVWPSLRGEAAPADAATRFEAALERLGDLSPRIEAPATGVALVDVAGLQAMHGTEAQVAATLAARAAEVAPPPVRMGIGDNRWLATLAARLARPNGERAGLALLVIPPGQGRAVLGELPIGLLPADAATRDRFSLFGLTCMGQLAALPRSAVASQFGAAGERLQALARGEDPRPLVPRRRPERLAATFRFEPPVEGLTGITLALRRVATQLTDRLRARRLAPGRAALTLQREDAPGLAVSLTLPEPTVDPDWIARLLLARLEADAGGRANPAGSDGSADEPRITVLGLALDHLTNPISRQLPAFDPQAGRWEELRWSLERIGTRFGPDRLWRAVADRPQATLPERQARLESIGP